MAIDPQDLAAIMSAFSSNYNNHSASLRDHYSVVGSQDEEGEYMIAISVNRITREQYKAIHNVIAPLLDKYYFEMLREGYTFYFSSRGPLGD